MIIINWICKTISKINNNEYDEDKEITNKELTNRENLQIKKRQTVGYGGSELGQRRRQGRVAEERQRQGAVYR